MRDYFYQIEFKSWTKRSLILVAPTKKLVLGSSFTTCEIPMDLPSHFVAVNTEPPLSPLLVGECMHVYANYHVTNLVLSDRIVPEIDLWEIQFCSTGVFP